MVHGIESIKVMAKQLQKLFQRGSGMPRGAGFGIKLLGSAAIIGYGITQSLYTGKQFLLRGH